MLGRGYEGDVNGNGLAKDNIRTVISVWRSIDAARTWTCFVPEIPAADGEHLKNDMFHGLHVVELSDGTLRRLVRYHGAECYLYETRSTDGGRTWSPMQRTGIFGYPAHQD